MTLKPLKNPLKPLKNSFLIFMQEQIEKKKDFLCRVGFFLVNYKYINKKNILSMQ